MSGETSFRASAQGGRVPVVAFLPKFKGVGNDTAMFVKRNG